jgi:hypothetical protein
VRGTESGRWGHGLDHERSTGGTGGGGLLMEEYEVEWAPAAVALEKMGM